MNAINAETPKIKCNSKRSGVLKSHEPRDIITMVKEETNALAYVDYRVITFDSREELIVESKIACRVMAK